MSLSYTKENGSLMDAPINPTLKPISSVNTIRSEMSIENTPSIDILQYDQDKRNSQSLVYSAFSLGRNETLVGEYPCYLVRLVTLPGWMYLTDEQICFFASLPGKEEAQRKSGYLTKKNHRASPLNSRYYFVLQFHVLSWYESAESHYQPLGSIELKNAIDIRESTTRPLGFKVITPTGKYTFVADSMVSKKDWLDDLRRTMFMAKNDGNSVRIVLPFNKTTMISKASAFEFAEYIKVSVSDSQQPQHRTVSVEGDDDYYFAFFPDINEAYKMVYDYWKKKFDLDGNNYDSHDGETESDLYDEDNQIDAASPITQVFNFRNFGDEEINNSRAPTFPTNAFAEGTYPSLIFKDGNNNTYNTTFKNGPMIQLPERYSTTHDSPTFFGKPNNRLSDGSHALLESSSLATHSILDYTHNAQLLPSISKNAIPTTDSSTGITPKRIRSGSLKTIRHFAALPFQQLASLDYLPSVKRQNSSVPPDNPSLPYFASTTNIPHDRQTKNVTTSETTSTRKHLPLPATPYLLQLASPLMVYKNVSTDQHSAKKKEQLSSASMWLSPDLRHRLGMDTSPTSTTGDIETDDVVEEQYQEILNVELQRHFPMLGTDAIVNAVYRGSVWRMLPYYGRLYFTQDYACFHANVLAGRQKIVIPFNDIVNIRILKSRGYHLLHGLGVTTKDMNEEIFFEFMSTELRDSACELLSIQSQKRLNDQLDFSGSDSNKDESNLILESENSQSNQPECMADGTTEHVIPPFEYNGPPLLSNLSTSEQYLSRRDSIKPLVITCLTIGSRGDVQPYIALCKRLQQEDGHHCRIASHEEYKTWIESYGIEFKSIGGDPGDLMRLCVENGFLSFSFIKNGYKFFYDWFETLLKTSWEACQGTDVLIESPSAMVGVHLAEKLEIPYFRSMPFPWTRTTKFPHPFATLNHNGGRIYNDMTYVVIEMALWAGISRSVNRFRREKLALAPTTLERLELWRVPYLYSFSPLVQPAPKDWPDYIHCTGYWFLDNGESNRKESWQASSELLSFLQLDKDQQNGTEKDTRPVVYIGFGSIMVSDPETMSRVIVEAVMEANVRAIVCKGWSSRKSASQQQKEKKAVSASTSTRILYDYPGSILHLDSVPHDWLFPLIQGVVHHGGAGTCAAGLRAGLPTVIKPFFGDQRFWGRRVEELGVGICIPKLTKMILKQQLVTITQDKAMIRRAKLLGEAIRRENGTKTAMECLYRNMGLAKRTKQPDTTDQMEKQDSHGPMDNNSIGMSLYSYAAKLKHLPQFGTDASSDGS